MNKIELKCIVCNTIFYKTPQRANEAKKFNWAITCSKVCLLAHKTTAITVSCNNCKKNFIKQLCNIAKTKNNFCTKSCAATYNNTHKTKGYRRSKLEFYLEEQLKILYPNLEIKFNDKTTINSELDIYIPSLNLAFELNGIFHYEPIYGLEKLSQIQNNDNRKFQACLEKNISLCIIDTSKFGYFKKEKAREFLSIVINVISTKSLVPVE